LACAEVEESRAIPQARAAQLLGVGGVEPQFGASGSDRRLLLGLEFPQPSLNVREQMRLVAVRTIQWGYSSRQGSEGLGIEIDTGIHFSPRRWAVEFQECHCTQFQTDLHGGIA
jgi:hypothetical protein